MANIYPIELIVQKNFKLVCKANKSSSGAQGSEHVPYTLTVDPIYNGYAKEVHVGYVSDSKKIEELCPNGYVTLNAFKNAGPIYFSVHFIYNTSTTSEIRSTNRAVYMVEVSPNGYTLEPEEDWEVLVQRFVDAIVDSKVEQYVPKYVDPKQTAFETKINNDIAVFEDSVEKDIDDFDDRVTDMEGRMATPFNFKGELNTASQLPTSGNKVNDMYYVKQLKCIMIWNGTAWKQGSISETDYVQELESIIKPYNDANEYTRIAYQTPSEEIEVPTYQEFTELSNEVDNKMERYVMRLVKTGTNTYKMTSLDDADLSFQEVYNITRKLNEYVVVVYGNNKLRPQYVSTNEIMFIGLDRSTESKILRILLTSTRLTYETFKLAEYEDVTDLKADLTKITYKSESHDRNISALWKVTEGQVYDIEEVVEVGRSNPPSGSTNMTILDVRGKSDQDGTPTPDNPIEIKSAEEINIKVIGKNLADVNTLVNGKGYKINGIVVEPSLGYFKIPVSVGDTITVSGESNFSAQWRDVLLDANENIIATYNTRVSTSTFSFATPYTFTVPNNAKWFAVTCYIASGNAFRDVETIQIEKGDKATDYETYTEQSYIITPSRPLNKIGNYFDMMDVERGMYVRNIGTVMCEQATAIDSEGKLASIATQNDAKKFYATSKTTAICDSATSDTLNNVRGKDSGIAQNVNTFWFRNSAIQQSVSSYTSWLSQHPVKIVYELENKTEEPIPQEDLDFLRSLELLPIEKHIIITDQDGNDVSFLLEYIVKLREV